MFSTINPIISVQQNTFMSNKFTKIHQSMQDLAKTSDSMIRHSACLIYKGKIVSSATNSSLRSYVRGVSMPAMHAEVATVSNYLGHRCRLLQVQSSQKGVKYITREEHQLYNQQSTTAEQNGRGIFERQQCLKEGK
jgi:hypothetical protein